MLIIKFKLLIPLLIITSIIILILLIKFPITYKVKIENFWLTYLAAISYISFYILLFLFLRILYINKTTDLKQYYYIIEILQSTTLYYKCLIILSGISLILIWIIIFIKVRKILSWKCWQLHFYWVNLENVRKCQEYFLEECFQKNYSRKKAKISDIYHRFVHIFEDHFSLYTVTFFIYKIILYIMRKFKGKTYTFYYKIHHYAPPLYLLILSGFIGILLYEIIWQNWVIYYTLYYLFFYMIFGLWYRISLLFWYGIHSLNIVIFEQTYCEPEIYYVNLTALEEKELQYFIQKPSDLRYRTYNRALHPIITKRRFYKTKAIHHKLWFDNDNFLKTKEYIWCNHDRDPSIMFWFNQEQLITKNNKHSVVENQESKLIGE